MSPRGLVCLFVLVSAFFATVPTAHALTLRVESEAVVATEVTRGGSAVIFAVTFESGSVPVRGRKAEILRDDDGDGIVKLAMPEGVPFIGIWSVVDLTTGAVQLGTQRDYELIDLEVPIEASFRDDGRGRFSKFEHPASDVEMLVVRPGQGAWMLRGTNGGEEDEDYEADGKLVLGLQRLVPLTPQAQAPEGVRAGDVVVVINVGEMRASAVTFGAAK